MQWNVTDTQLQWMRNFFHSFKMKLNFLLFFYFFFFSFHLWLCQPELITHPKFRKTMNRFFFWFVFFFFFAFHLMNVNNFLYLQVRRSVCNLPFSIKNMKFEIENFSVTPINRWPLSKKVSMRKNFPFGLHPNWKKRALPVLCRATKFFDLFSRLSCERNKIGCMARKAKILSMPYTIHKPYIVNTIHIHTQMMCKTTSFVVKRKATFKSFTLSLI